MRIYLAAQYDRRVELNGYAVELEAEGHWVTSRWLAGTHTLTYGVGDREAAEEDLEDIRRADMVIVFTEPPGTGPPRGGRHVETGYALGRRMRLVIVGPVENIFHVADGVDVRFEEWGAEVLDYVNRVAADAVVPQ